jgi:hypothetical protein
MEGRQSTTSRSSDSDPGVELRGQSWDMHQGKLQFPPCYRPDNVARRNAAPGCVSRGFRMQNWPPKFPSFGHLPPAATLFSIAIKEHRICEAKVVHVCT